MNKISLQEILNKHLEAGYIISGEKIPSKYITPLYACMQEVWNLAVDKCVESAEGYYYDESGEECDAHISEFSILKVKDYIK
jgi:hypothetical protein